MIHTKEPFKFENLKVGNICISGDEVELKVIHIEDSLDFPIICVSANQCVNNYSKDGLSRFGYTRLTHIKQPFKHKIGNRYILKYGDTIEEVMLVQTDGWVRLISFSYGRDLSHHKVVVEDVNSITEQEFDHLTKDLIRIGFEFSPKTD